MSDDEDVKPTPFAIKLVQEAPRICCAPKPPEPKPSDNFYRSWDSFLSKSSRRGALTPASRRPVAADRKVTPQHENGLNSQESCATSYEQAKAECKAKVRAIVTECRRLNQKYWDRHFDLELEEANCLFPLGSHKFNRREKDDCKPSAVKRVEDIFETPLFNEDKACADDVIQGQLGDCWLLASLMSISAGPGLIKRLCVDRDETVGVYGFVFFRDGTWIPEVIDDRLFLHVSDGEDLFVGKYVEDEKRSRKKEVGTINNAYDIQKLRDSLQKGGEALFFARCRDNSNTWLPLIEKAYAKAHGDYGSLDGGDTSEGIEDLCGGVSVTLKPSQILDKNKFWEEMKEVNTKYLFAGGARHWERNGKSANHAYAVLQTAEHGDLRLLKIRDPWGRHQDDGPWNHKFSEWTADLVERLKYDFKDPGVFWMTYQNFLKHFYGIDRTRLFDEEWKLNQQWTSVNVPPIADYLDTGFEFTLSQKGPTVVILCQPDSRYFTGLEGRYEFSLHFRVYDKKDKAKYLARSMHDSGSDNTCTRSVSADLELEAGTYRVLVKVTPQRLSWRNGCGNVVSTYQHRQEKLLQVGHKFDLAHSRGKRREMESLIRQQQIEDERRRKRDANAKARRMRQNEKARQQKRKERIAAEKTRRSTQELLQRAAKALPPGVTVVDGRDPELISKDCIDEDSEIEDDSFSWDSDLDGSVSGSSTEEEDDVFAEDPWNAVCVLGLRVYSLNSDAGITIVEGNDDESIEITPVVEGEEGDVGNVVSKNVAIVDAST
ncbi:hypothetical protein MBLNU459_g4508t1 [Dothideomycetes sp. NU459]